jgi:hypothetical protein
MLLLLNWGVSDISFKIGLMSLLRQMPPESAGAWAKAWQQAIIIIIKHVNSPADFFINPLLSAG